MGFDPSQARDDHGRWSGGGSGGVAQNRAERIQAKGEKAAVAERRYADVQGTETPEETRANEIENLVHETKFMPPSERAALRQEQAGLEEKLSGASVGQQDHAEPTPQQGDAQRHSDATAADTRAAQARDLSDSIGRMSRSAKVGALVSGGLASSPAEARAMLEDMGE